MNRKLIALAVLFLVAGIGVGYIISTFTILADYRELQEDYNLLIESMDIRFMKIESASMEPSLKIGDVVVVRGVENPCEIQVEVDGDIIAFYRPMQGDIIIHRAIDKILVDGTWYFKTQV